MWKKEKQKLNQITYAKSSHIPAIALRAMSVIPGMTLHFDLNREKSIVAIEEAMKQDGEILLITQKDPEKEDPEGEDLYEIGTIAKIMQIDKMPEGILRIFAEGICRAKITAFGKKKEYIEVIAQRMLEGEMDAIEEEAMVRILKDQFVAYTKLNPQVGKTVLKHLDEVHDLVLLMEEIMNNLPFSYEDKQKYLDAIEVGDRFEQIIGLLQAEKEISKIRMDLAGSMRQRIEKNQKEYILREQMQYIKEELGDEKEDEAFEERFQKLQASDAVKARISKEMKKMKAIPTMSPEHGIQETYVENLLDMPWDRRTEEELDLQRAKQILEDEHYGLEKVKESILEYLAVRSLTMKGECPILCLVGPPGTGKTSIVRSIAAACNRKYVRVCLGGVRDEAEIRGHRRTYLGAMPGRIANGLKLSGVNNPVMLLDEIDKTGKDQRGDTASALLEVLDSEQNQAFRDHYLEIPMDLSNIMFVATANSLDTIPKPLLDRMELIEVNSYTSQEKFHIAKKYLIPKQLERNGLSTEQLSFSDDAIQELIGGYTKEAGVRELERKIMQVCRKTAWKILMENEVKIALTQENLSELIGKRKYFQERKAEQNQVGIVRGLAWTSVGGVTLEVEVNIMPGKGNIELTGKLGDVMKESAKAGISYIRSHADRWNIDAIIFEENDIHIHIPEGAVPKDGPSAGVTMVTAVLSALTNTPVQSNVAMTGEITLRGRVLPIGGLKEKCIAALMAGCNTVIIPKDNEKDMDELPNEIKDQLDVHYATEIDDVLQIALVQK